MTLNEYQETASETMHLFQKNPDLMPFYLVLGLSEEAGEVAQRLKRMISGGRAYPSSADRGALMLELGDVLWYLANIANWAGIQLDDVALANQEKLGMRRPR